MKPELIKFSIGIDVSMKSFMASIIQYQLIDQVSKRIGRKSFSNTPSGHKELVSWVRSKISVKSSSVVYAMEATGVYHEALAYHLARSGHTVSILLPNIIKAYGKSLNLGSKTDLSDANLIGYYAAERQVFTWAPASDNQLKIKRLTRQRGNFVRQRTQLKNELHAEKHTARADRLILANYKKMIKHYDAVIKALDKKIKEALHKDEVYKKTAERLQSVPGIGPVTAATLVAETDAFKLFTKKAQLVKFCGLDVVANQSGSSINGPGKISKTGNGRIRAALHMAAWSAKRAKGPFKDYYERVYNRTKLPNKAIVALQRKVLVIAYACVKNGEDYDPKKHKKDVADNEASHCASTSMKDAVLSR